MNRISSETRSRIVHALCEGVGFRVTARLCDVSVNTVAKIIRDLGAIAKRWHDANVIGLPCSHLQCDELVSFVGSKTAKRYTWLAMDPASKLIVSWHTGGRSRKDAMLFLDDVAGRVSLKPQISTDAYAAYKPCIAEAFGCGALHSIVGKTSPEFRRGECVHTSFIERLNLTVRTMNARFARRSMRFSKSDKFHGWMLALTIVFYNFCKVHGSLRVTPAMEAGLAESPWSIEDLCRLGAA